MSRISPAQIGSWVGLSPSFQPGGGVQKGSSTPASFLMWTKSELSSQYSIAPSALCFLINLSWPPGATLPAMCLSRWSNRPVSPMSFLASNLNSGLSMGLPKTAFFMLHHFQHVLLSSFVPTKTPKLESEANPKFKRWHLFFLLLSRPSVDKLVRWSPLINKDLGFLVIFLLIRYPCPLRESPSAGFNQL